jgi:hypothetical protein
MLGQLMMWIGAQDPVHVVLAFPAAIAVLICARG